VALIDAAPAQQRVRINLHGTLACDHSLTLMMRRVVIFVIRSISRRQFFLDLKKEWIFAVMRKQQNNIITCSNASGSRHLESDINGFITVKQRGLFRAQYLPILRKRR